MLSPERVRVFYLATAPDLYGPICHNIGAAGAQAMVRQMPQLPQAVRQLSATDVAQAISRALPNADDQAKGPEVGRGGAGEGGVS